MDDLISRSALLQDIENCVVFSGRPGIASAELRGANKITDRIKAAPAVDAVVLPCKIGDEVWAIRNYKGIKRAQKAPVNEMFFNKNMELVLVVFHVARGIWGKTVFATQEEAEKALEERNNK